MAYIQFNVANFKENKIGDWERREIGTLEIAIFARAYRFTRGITEHIILSNFCLVMLKISCLILA